MNQQILSYKCSIREDWGGRGRGRGGAIKDDIKYLPEGALMNAGPDVLYIEQIKCKFNVCCVVG